MCNLPFLWGFLYLCGMEKFLIEGLVGRNLSELLHALRQEQGTPRAADVLWKGRSELRRAGIGKVSIKHTQLECWEKFQTSCFHIFDKVKWKHRDLISILNGNCLIIKWEIRNSPLCWGTAQPMLNLHPILRLKMRIAATRSICWFVQGSSAVPAVR